MKSFTSFLLIILSIVLFFWYIKPAYSSMLDTQAEFSKYDTALTQATQAGVKRDELVNRYNSFSSADLARLNTFLPSSVDTLQLATDLNAIASKYGSSIKTFTTSNYQAQTSNVVTPATEQPYQILNVNVSVSMTYDNFLLFIRDVEKSLRLMDIGSVTFKPTDTSSVYDYTITFQTYFLK